MYLNVSINDKVNVKVAPISIAEIRAMQRTTEGLVELSEDHKDAALAAAMTSDSWANQPTNEDVIDYTWDYVNDELVATPLPGERSAFHWQEMSQLAASGLQFEGLWTVADCSVPPTPTVSDDSATANGLFYIIESITGDTTGCSEFDLGDWLVWTGDTVGPPVTGEWSRLDHLVSWDKLINVPENVSNALSRSGGTMTDQIKGVAPIADADLTRKDYVDDANALQDTAIAGKEPANVNIQAHIVDVANPHTVTAAQAGAEPANVNIQAHIVDVANPHTVTAVQVGALPLTGGTVTGQILGIAPVAAADLTRKDYVDTKLAVEDMYKAIGNVSNPMLDLPLHSNLDLAKGVGTVDFKRATTATYVDSYGNLVSAAIDEARFEKKGLLIEGISTNHTLNSEDLSAGSYSNDSGLTVVPDTHLSPEGTQTMDTLQSDGISNGFNRFSIETAVAGSFYSFSVWVAKIDSDVIALTLNNADGFYSALFTFSTELFSVNAGLKAVVLAKGINSTYRLGISLTAANSDTRIESRLYPQPTAETASKSVAAWGWQLEAMPFSTSYIPTTTAEIERGADAASLEFYGNHPCLLEGNAFTELVDASLLGDLYGLTRCILNSGQNFFPSYSMFRYNNGTGGVSYFRGSALTTEGVNNRTKVKRYGAIVSDDNEVSLYIGGLLKASGVQALNNVTISGTKRIGLGSKDSTDTDFLYGHISNVRIYNQALTALEMSLA